MRPLPFRIFSLLSVAVLTLSFAGCEKPEQKAQRALRDAGLEMNAEDFTASAGRGDKVAIENFLLGGIEIDATNTQGLNALLLASERGHTEVAKLLLGAGANPDKSTPDGWSPLMAASQGNHAEIVKALLEANAAVDSKDTNGWTATMKAVYAGHTESTVLLAPHAKEELDRALLLAALLNHGAIIPVLVENGADVNTANEDKQTPLMFAAIKGNRASVEALLALKADTTIADRSGTTADMLALQRGHGDLSVLIANAGAGDGSYRPLGAPNPSATPGAAISPDPSVSSEPAALPTPEATPMADGTTPGNEPVLDPLLSDPLPTVAIPEPAMPDPGVGSIYPETSGAVRETAPAIAENTLPGIVYREYREEAVPFLLTGVDGSEVTLVMTDGSNKELRLATGQRVDGTPYRIASARPKQVTNKDGVLDDVSEAVITHLPSGESITIIKDIQAYSPGTSGQIEVVETARVYTVRNGGNVEVEGFGSFRVIDLRADQVLLESADGSVHTLPRK